MATLTVPFVQLIYPMNFPQNVETDIDDTDGKLAEDVEFLQSQGYKLYCRWLDAYGLYVAFAAAREGDKYIASKQCKNGPEVPYVVSEMIRDAAIEVRETVTDDTGVVQE